MNEAIYRLADSGGSVRIVIQKKNCGDYIIGISNGRDSPLICQGEQTQVDTEFESALPGYLEKLKVAAMEAKLRAAINGTDSPDESETTMDPPSASEEKTEQPELDFGF